MNAALDALIALAALGWLVFATQVALVAARMYQIEEYEGARFLRWGASRAWLLHRAVVGAGVVGAAALAVALVFPAHGVRAAAAGWLCASIVGALLWRWVPPKKALVFTARMRRILALTALLGALVGAAGAVLLALGHGRAGAAAALVSVALLPLLAQLLLVAANTALGPVEATIRRAWLRRARARLDAVNPVVVAVAGSYGKTSTKHILAALLQPSINTLATRQSFNTLMGVSRAINEDLRGEHGLFVVEMDAYAPGEIAAICALVRPAAAIVTSVGPQHLERFGSMDRIGDALYEAVTALPAGGVAVVHGGEAAVAALAQRALSEGRVVTRYGTEVEAADGAALDVVASHVQTGASGSRFRWAWPERSIERDVDIPLLGVHQVLNVTAALALVAALGYDLDAAAAAARSLQPVEHRLQPLRTGGPVTVIDDSYNANPVGVHNGLDVLASMDGAGKILVTPGLVELGEREVPENRRYGEHAARVCSDVIVMDARPAAALVAGLRAGGLAEPHIHVVRSLAEATAVIGRISRPGDVVLFANDLPDTYLTAR